MKLNNFPDTLKSATLFAATTLAACGGAPATQAPPNQPERSAPVSEPEQAQEAAPVQIEEISLNDPSVQAAGFLARIKEEIRAVAHTHDATANILHITTPDGVVYEPKLITDPGTDLFLNSVKIYGEPDGTMSAQARILSHPGEMFAVETVEDGHLDCAGPKEVIDWRDSVPGVKSEDWVCAATPHLLDANGKVASHGPTTYLPLGGATAEDFVEVRSDIDLMIGRIKEASRKLDTENRGSTPVQGQ